MTIRIVVADDHGVIREGLGALLSGRDGYELVGTAATGAEAVRSAVTLKPDVLVMDIQMPGMSGIEATREIGRVYASDLAGAGIGAVAVVPLMWLVDAPKLVVALGAAQETTAETITREREKKRDELAKGFKMQDWQKVDDSRQFKVQDEWSGSDDDTEGEEEQSEEDNPIHPPGPITVGNSTNNQSQTNVNASSNATTSGNNTSNSTNSTNLSTNLTTSTTYLLSKGSYIILGGVFLRNFYTVFDADNKRVSFAKVVNIPPSVITTLEVIYLIFGIFILVMFLVFVACFIRIWTTKKTPMTDKPSLEKDLLEKKVTSSQFTLTHTLESS